MKGINLIVFLVLSSIAFGQEVNQTDAQGRKQGKWEKIYPGTRVYMYRGQFVDDEPIGQFLYFYKSSKLKAVIEHDSLSNRAECYYYHPTGGIMSSGILRDLKKDSVWVNFDKLGKVSSKETFKKDSLHGARIIFYPPAEGSKRQSASEMFNYDNGTLHGEYRAYFESGRTKSEGTYEKGKKHGIWKNYHHTGRVMNLQRYKSGVRHGWCTTHDESGKQITKNYIYYGRHLTGKELKKKMEEFKRLGVNPND